MVPSCDENWSIKEIIYYIAMHYNNAQYKDETGRTHNSFSFTLHTGWHSRFDLKAFNAVSHTHRSKAFFLFLLKNTDGFQSFLFFIHKHIPVFHSLITRSLKAGVVEYTPIPFEFLWYQFVTADRWVPRRQNQKGCHHNEVTPNRSQPVHYHVAAFREFLGNGTKSMELGSSRGVRIVLNTSTTLQKANEHATAHIHRRRNYIVAENRHTGEKETWQFQRADWE